VALDDQRHLQGSAEGVGQSRTEQKIGAEQSRFFGLNERNLLTG
jgi:hypothetical protein